MISVKEAESLVLSTLAATPTQTLAIEELADEYLRQDVFADRPYPPFHRVAMDGIAIVGEMYVSGERRFPMQSCQRAGEPVHTLNNQEHCIEVMTGSPLPLGCDSVIPFEWLKEDGNDRVVADNNSFKLGQNIHVLGSDYEQGDLLLKEGARLSSRHWSILASVGLVDVKIATRPKIALVSTGDELVDVRSTPQDHQIRMSNSWVMKAAFKEHGFNQVDLFHLPDSEEGLRSKLYEILENYDHIVLSGGVSKGRFDFVPQVLISLGVKKAFHRIAQKPGKPMWFGVTDSKQGVFGLPGNPNSALTCLHRYVLPALKRTLSSVTPKGFQAILTEDVGFKKDMTLFLPVRVQSNEQGQLMATPVKNNGSGDFTSIVESDGFLELPRGQDIYQQNQTYPMFLWSGGLS